MSNPTVVQRAGGVKSRSAVKEAPTPHEQRQSSAHAPVPETLLVDEHEGARLCSVSFWTFREWTTAGLIPVVAPPSPLNPRRTIRRRLVDRRDIEAFIATYKSGGVR